MPPPGTGDHFWSKGDLADDVATFSYDGALRAHSEHPSPDFSEAPKAETGVPGNAPEAAHAQKAGPGAALYAEPERILRPASVTVRLSNEESAQLHQRAEEAGLTVSAYVRSCTFEVDALRAQVKATLAEMKAGTKGPREQGNERLEHRGGKGIGLARVFIRIGRICVGLSSCPVAP